MMLVKSAYQPPAPLLYACRILSAMVIALCAICYIPMKEGSIPTTLLYALIPLCLLCNALPYLLYRRIPRNNEKRSLLSPSHSRHTLRSCAHGVEILHVFLLAVGFSVVYHLARLSMLWTGRWADWLISAAVAIGVLAVVFWNGMLSLYIYSVQLGIRWRVIGALCGLIPIAQLIVLRRIMQVVETEVEVECARIDRNNTRREERVCETKYPILMVHGVFFRDFKHLNYWGRIPYDLEQNGATVYYGGQHSAAAVADCASDKRLKSLYTKHISAMPTKVIISRVYSRTKFRYSLNGLHIPSLYAGRCALTSKTHLPQALFTPPSAVRPWERAVLFEN